VGFAAPGDTNLDGVFDIQDAANFFGGNQLDVGGPSNWEQGDFNHDGVVDLLDVSEMLGAGLYDAGGYLPASQAAASAAAAPESSSLSAADVAFAALAGETTVGTGRKKSVFAVI